MTWRAIILGCSAGILIAGFGYLNDSIFRLNFIVGNHFPITVFGLLTAFCLALNPLLRRFLPKLALSAPELALIVAFALVGSTIPGSGLMREFTQIMALPAHYELTTPGWRRSKVLQLAPPQLLMNGGQYDEEATSAYVTGESGGNQEILRFDKIPWHVWVKPLCVWLPILILSAIGSICMALIVHPQWSRREHLPYPIAWFGRTIISGSIGGVPLLGNRSFRNAFLLVLGIRVLNGLYTYFPEYLVQVPVDFNFAPLVQLWPNVTRAGGWWAIFYPRLYPSVIAFGCLLASEVSLSLGLSQLVAVPILAILVGYGVSVQDGQMGTGILSWQMFGSYLAMSGVVLYVGRHHYFHVVRGAFWCRSAEKTEGFTEAVWACRVLALTVVAFVAVLTFIGLDWPFAILLVGLLFMMFMVTARISAETGLPHIETNWNALGVFIGLFGMASLGPKAVVIGGLICAMLMVDVREALMPFVTNGLKLCDDEGVPTGRVGASGGLVFLGGLALAIPVVLAAIYSAGVPLVDGWGSWAVPRFAFDHAEKTVMHLQASGELATSEALGPIQRLAHMSPEPGFLWAVGVGVGLVLVCSLLRLRFSRWPFHPVIFLTWTTWPLMRFSHSFLLGWLIKKAVSKYGGQRLYAAMQPMLIGVIAGDIVGGLIFMAVGAIYYAYHGSPAPSYYIFPE